VTHVELVISGAFGSATFRLTKGFQKCRPRISGQTQ
jgi:hypothetical protein